MNRFLFLLFFLITDNKVGYFQDLDFMNFEGRIPVLKRDASFKIKSIENSKVIVTHLKSKKNWQVTMSDNSKLIVNQGEKFPGCVYIDSALVFKSKIVRIKNCKGITSFQNIQIIKKIDSISYSIDVCYLSGSRLTLANVNEEFTLNPYKIHSTKFVEFKIKDLGDRLQIKSQSTVTRVDASKDESYELKKVHNSFFLTLESLKSELNY
ncbi:MAG: hypothetical protein KF775_14420 [Cyclobacteriaceae bacterium]|nr:hypothetical protein [Cyclobacteriaceae bacterium]